MKIKLGFFILTGFAFYILNSLPVSAKNNGRNHHFTPSPIVSTQKDVDPKEKDVGRGEGFGKLDSKRLDIDVKEKDLGRGEPSASLTQDIDSHERDLGQGEPFNPLPASAIRGTHAGGGEILVGSDFTDAIEGKNFSDKSLLNSITLQSNSPVNNDEVHFKP